MHFAKMARPLMFILIALAVYCALISVASAGSNSGYFQLNQLPSSPQNPLCDSQVNPTTITTVTPTFTWTFNDTDGGDTQGGFHIIVGVSDGDASLWNYTVTSPTASVVYAGSALSRGVTYHWKIQVNDTYEATMGPYCGDQTFKINSLPTATVNSPENNSLGQALLPTLIWNYNDVDSDTQTNYHLQVADNVNFNTPIIDQNVSSSSSFYDVSTPLVNNTYYYWKIKISDGKEWSDYQGWWVFKTTNITVAEIRTFNSSYTPKTSFSVGDKVIIQYNVTNVENQNNTFITIKDPTGTRLVNNESVASVQDSFSTANNWNENNDSHWNIATGTYQHGAGGGSGVYGDYSLIKTSVFENQTNLTMQADVNIDFSNEDMERLIFRWNDSRNYSAGFISETYSTIGIEEIVDGTRYKEETSRLFSEDTWYRIKVSVVGDEATISVNGLEMVTKTLNRNVAGRMGLGTDTGWIYFDNFSIGYNSSRVVGAIPGGWQYEYNYTIPNNESLAGTWDIICYAQSGGQTASNSATFDALSENPLIKNITTYNATYVDKAVFHNGEQIIIRAWVADDDGASNITECNITITNHIGLVKVNQVDMTIVDSIANGNIYEYNYTVPHELASQGIWNITVQVHDTALNTATGYKEFEDDLNSPNISKVATYNNLAEKKSVFALGETAKIRAWVSDPDGAGDIKQCNVTIKAPNGTIVVANVTMTDIGDITNGNIYEYEYVLPSTQADYGTWEMTIRANDTYYNDTEVSHMVLVWANTSYYHRKPILLTEKFGMDRINEQKGFNVSLPASVCGGNNTIRVLNEKGEEVPIKIQRKSNSDYWVSYVVNISADEASTYYLYYNMTGTAGSYYDTYDTLQEMTLSESNYTLMYNQSGTNITYGKGLAVGDINNDGQPEIVVVGRTGALGMHYFFIWVYNTTFTDNNVATTNCLASMEWNGSNQMAFGYSVKLEDLNGDGTKEIIAGGTTYDGTRNKAVILVLNYSNGVLTELANSTWYDDVAGDTSVFGVYCSDVDGDGVKEILTAGTTGTNNNRGQFAVHNFTGGTIKHEYFHNISLTQSSPNNWTELYAISVGNLYDSGGNPQVLVAGEGKDSSGKINAYFLVMTCTGGVWVQDSVISWLQSQLTELFSCAIGDVDNDNKNEILVSGNYFDGVRDVAMYRVYYTDGPTYPATISQDMSASQSWYVYGYSSALTALIDDCDFDNLTEIVTVGFQNDGTMDRGDYKIRLYNGTATVDEYSQLWIKDKARRSGDFYDAGVLYDLNNDGFKELIDTGRYDLTPPTGTFIRIQSIGGVNQTFGNEDLLAPQKPTGSTVTGHTSDSIALSWTKASDANNTVVVYKKGSAPSSRTDGTIAYNDTGSSTTVSSLDAGTHYYFSLWSWRNGSSNYSDTYDTTDGYTNPGNPTILAHDPTSNSMQISITKGTNSTNTVIVRNESGYGGFPSNLTNGTTIYNDTGASTSDSGLKRITTYYYSAWAYDTITGYWSDGYGTDSEDTSPEAPSVQTNETTGSEETNATGHGYVIDDGGSSCSAGFYYDITTGGTTNNVTATGSFSTGSEFGKDFTSLTKGELYYFSAWAGNSNGFTKAGNELKFLTKPDAPTSLDGYASYNSITLNWNEATCGFGESVGTRIQYRTDTYPTSVDDGFNTYNGTIETCMPSASSDTHYYFTAWAWVRAESNDLFQWSDGSVTFDVWTPPAPPGSFIAIALSDEYINLTWTNGSGITTVLVRNESGYEGFPSSITNGTLLYNGTNTWYNDINLKHGVNYYYSAFSYNATRDLYSVPASANASTMMLELNISVSPNNWDFGNVSIDSETSSTNYSFNLTNNGMSARVVVTVSNSVNWSFVNYSGRGHNKFAMNLSKTNWSDQTNINTEGTQLTDDLNYLMHQLFDLKVLTPTSMDALGDGEMWTVTVTATAN